MTGRPDASNRTPKDSYKHQRSAPSHTNCPSLRHHKRHGHQRLRPRRRLVELDPGLRSHWPAQVQAGRSERAMPSTPSRAT